MEAGGRVWCMQVQTGLAMARPYLQLVTVGNVYRDGSRGLL